MKKTTEANVILTIYLAEKTKKNDTYSIKGEENKIPKIHRKEKKTPKHPQEICKTHRMIY